MTRTTERKVVIAAPVHTVLLEGLEALGYSCRHHEDITQNTAPALLADCVGIITSTRLLLDKELLAAAPHLRWIGRMGSGMEVIDVNYAQLRGIKCHASPEGNSNAVGEHALGMLLSLVRRIGYSHNEVVQGIWKRDQNRGNELEGKTVGIIGFGHTGRAFAKKLRGFDVRVLAYDKYDGRPADGDEVLCSLERIQDEADIISFHVPHQPDTIGYCDARFINAMRNPFLLINTSRGAVVNTEDVLDAMDTGKIAGACLDVFEREPVTSLAAALLERLTERMKQPNLVVTPHIAGYTFEALYKMSKVLLEKIAADNA